VRGSVDTTLPLSCRERRIRVLISLPRVPYDDIAPCTTIWFVFRVFCFAVLRIRFPHADGDVIRQNHNVIGKWHVRNIRKYKYILVSRPWVGFLRDPNVLYVSYNATITNRKWNGTKIFVYLSYRTPAYYPYQQYAIETTELFNTFMGSNRRHVTFKFVVFGFLRKTGLAVSCHRGWDTVNIMFPTRLYLICYVFVNVRSRSRFAREK